jgi:hypothetical protein
MLIQLSSVPVETTWMPIQKGTRQFLSHDRTARGCGVSRKVRSSFDGSSIPTKSYR